MLATVSDKKIAIASTANPTLIVHYEADVVTAHDYYPGGEYIQLQHAINTATDEALKCLHELRGSVVVQLSKHHPFW